MCSVLTARTHFSRSFFSLLLSVWFNTIGSCVLVCVVVVDKFVTRVSSQWICHRHRCHAFTIFCVAIIHASFNFFYFSRFFLIPLYFISFSFVCAFKCWRIFSFAVSLFVCCCWFLLILSSSLSLSPFQLALFALFHSFWVVPFLHIYATR